MPELPANMMMIVISAIAAAAANAALYLVVIAPMRAQIRETETIKGRLTTAEESKITELEEEIRHAAERREKIYKRMEEKLMSQRECQRVQDTLSGTLTNLDRRMTGLQAQLTDVKETSDRTSASVGLIARQMHIDIGGIPERVRPAQTGDIPT